MKLITFFFFLGIFQVSASVYGQRGTVTLNLNELTMEDIFTAINRQLKYDIFYSDDELDVARKIKLTDSKMEVSKLLKEVLQDDYSYEFLNKTIVIRPVKQQQNPKIVIQGTVKDTKGIPLPGVSVVIQGSTVGVSTDNAGKFRMEVADLPDLVLVFSFVGMETREIPYRGEEMLNIVLKDAVTEIGEVVVTGLPADREKAVDQCCFDYQNRRPEYGRGFQYRRYAAGTIGWPVGSEYLCSSRRCPQNTGQGNGNDSR